MAYQRKGQQSFLLYYSWKVMFDKLTDADAGRLAKAIFAYKVGGELPALSPGAEMAFTVIRQQLDADAEKWQAICDQKSESGRKGGLVTQEQNRKAQVSTSKQVLENQADIDIEHEHDSVIDYEHEKNVNGSLGASPEASINWPIFQKMVTGVYKGLQERGGTLVSQLFPLNETLKIFDYFFQGYSEKFGRSHPLVSRKKVEEIILNMPYCEDDNDGKIIDLDPADYVEMIDAYFDNDSMNCDYHIQHFFSGGVRSIRFYEGVLTDRHGIHPEE